MKNSSDTQVLLNTNQMKVAKKVICGVVRDAVGVKMSPHPLLGFQVNIFSVVELIIRQKKLHRMLSLVLQLMIKVDGRPFWATLLTYAIHLHLFVLFVIFFKV